MRKKGYCKDCNEETDGVVFIRKDKDTMEERFYFRCKRKKVKGKACNKVTKI